MQHKIENTTAMEKIKVTQDELYQYLLEHDVKILRLSELMGTGDTMVTSCFKHSLDRLGVPRRFTAKSISLINQVLPQLASELRRSVLHYGSDQTYTNSHGHAYDPGQIEPIKDLGRYLNITGLTNRLLGWSQNKKSSVLCRPKAINYGNITKEDVTRINTEILSIAAVLDSYELVIDNDNQA